MCCWFVFRLFEWFLVSFSQYTAHGPLIPAHPVISGNFTIQSDASNFYLYRMEANYSIQGKGTMPIFFQAAPTINELLVKFGEEVKYWTDFPFHNY